ncbi:MAG: hypothetical protein QW175_06880 [Candidatus Bathyarchaeia archaeon]
MRETVLCKAEAEGGKVLYLCRNPVTGVWELAQLPEAKPEVKKVAKTKPSKPKLPVITMEQIADKANDDEEWRELIKFLNYLDECAKEEVRFLDPALEQARTGRYEQKKPPKPDKKKEVQKPFWTVIMGDPRVPYAEKSKCLLKWIREETEKYGRKN